MIWLDHNLMRLIREEAEKPLPLTLAEYRLVCCLIRPVRAIKTREQLIDAIDPHMEKSLEIRTIDSHMKRLRIKGRETLGEELPIITHYGAGYYWDADDPTIGKMLHQFPTCPPESLETPLQLWNRGSHR